MQLKPLRIFIGVAATVLDVAVAVGVAFAVLWICEKAGAGPDIGGLIVAEVGTLLLAAGGVWLWQRLSEARSLLLLHVLVLSHLLIGLPPVLFLFDIAACIDAPF